MLCKDAQAPLDEIVQLEHGYNSVPTCYPDHVYNQNELLLLLTHYIMARQRLLGSLPGNVFYAV